MKTTFICEDMSPSNGGKTKILMETEDESLDEILRCFEDFLRGCGFRPLGILDFVDHDEEEINNIHVRDTSITAEELLGTKFNNAF